MHLPNKFLAIANLCYKRYPIRCLTSKSFLNLETEKTQKHKSIVVEHVKNVTIIGINRPETKNALNVATAQELSHELDKFENDENSVVGVLHGLRGNFCSGYDLAEIAQDNGKNEEILSQFGPLINRIELSKKPLIAGIDGYAVGLGFELALMCDLRVIEKTAVLGFANRFEIPILCGGTVRLPALIGYSRAMDLILTGRCIEASVAFSWGLINRITETGNVLGETVKLAISLAKFPQRTLLADRASANYATFSAKHFKDAIQFEKNNASHLVFAKGVTGAKEFIKKGTGKQRFFDCTMGPDIFKELDKDLL